MKFDTTSAKTKFLSISKGSFHPHPSGSERGYPGLLTNQQTSRNHTSDLPPPPSWKNNPYIEEMQFPTAQSLANFGGRNGEAEIGNSQGGGGQRSSRLAPAQRRSQFFKLNKSSSLHDLAHEEVNMHVCIVIFSK